MRWTVTISRLTGLQSLARLGYASLDGAPSVLPVSPFPQQFMPQRKPAMAQWARRRRRRSAHVACNSTCIFVGSNGKLYRDPLPYSTLPNCTTPAAAVANLLAAAQPTTLIPCSSSSGPPPRASTRRRQEAKMASRKPQHPAAGPEYRVIPVGPDRWRIVDRQQRNHGAYTNRPWTRRVPASTPSHT